MPWKDPSLFPPWAPLAAIVSGVGALARWYENWMLGGKFRPLPFFIDMLISCTVGYLVFWMAVDFGQHLSVCACLAGVAGNVGSRIFDVARIVIGRRLGLPSNADTKREP